MTEEAKDALKDAAEGKLAAEELEGAALSDEDLEKIAGGYYDEDYQGKDAPYGKW